ncbi:GNAT family N-acetyltransferase [Mesorhizobium sp. M7A.F.Ca.MR.362.00.0.0]|uniref:GNAT family N-acetyltransferase n=1 Tax=Mesorhizobium sp. M7A.F.Ca.MR.362.00.0.0 TaxID=2496779 RepID=UPI000FD1D223|nr:GNAT family N-acetyltransferase [Mesorhizobium sp. M7A.F.Ca.MR.362.00.0.0]RUU74370.1 N-acetyltransferase [Mesorhizobium sp. M7A.F.Ca.MR.362.00.0.0]RWN95597.1 MAG: N-acetyltransferase [Mesorhizobium sp.]
MAEGDWHVGGTEINSDRLRLRPFTADDAEDLFVAITPAITRFMQWEPPRSLAAFAEVWRSWLSPIQDGSDLHFVVRALVDDRCLGLVGLHAAKTVCPELGIWIREDAQGNGIGQEAIAAVAQWASEALEPDCFEYPVAERNVASRRIAERLGGVIVGSRSSPKYNAVVYRIRNLRR